MEIDVGHLVVIYPLQLRNEVLLLRVEVLQVLEAGTLPGINFVQVVDEEFLAANRVFKVFF